MSDEIRKEKGAVGANGDQGAGGGQPPREESRPKDDELYTPQGGGGGTGSGPIREVAAVEGSPRVGPREDLREDVLRPGKITLPQVADRLAEKRGGADGAEGSGPAGPPGPGEEEEVSSVRLVLTLALAGAVAGALLVFVFLWSQPQIQAYDAMVLREAVTEVLHGPDHFESVFLHDGTLMTAASLPQGVDTLELDRVFLGYDQAGEPVGFALQAEGFGFQDLITLIFGYDPGTGEVLGMKVLKHLETPGLGDKIVKDSVFVRGFEGAEAPIQGVKPDRNTGDPHQVDMITGATISSSAVIRIINERLAEVGGLLDAYEPQRGLPAQRGVGEPAAADTPGNVSGAASNPMGADEVREECP
jgi:electron transport complex protein RnfG